MTHSSRPPAVTTDREGDVQVTLIRLKYKEILNYPLCEKQPYSPLEYGCVLQKASLFIQGQFQKGGRGPGRQDPPTPPPFFFLFFFGGGGGAPKLHKRRTCAHKCVVLF